MTHIHEKKRGTQKNRTNSTRGISIKRKEFQLSKPKLIQKPAGSSEASQSR
jgi:hypothetical protein